MAGRSPYTVELSQEERKFLQAVAAKYSSPYRDVIRAKIVLYAEQGLTNEQIAARVDLPRQIVSKWRKRFHEQRLAGLAERSRTGRPPVFSPRVVVEVKAIACELPATLGVPLSRLHVPDIRTAVVARGLVAQISDTTIWRWLSEDAIKPWQHRSWIFPRDPDFEQKAGVVLDLYHRTFQGRPLGPNEFVLSADEKTSIQARCRCHPTLPPAKARTMRVEHEYERGGALQYLAAWDCHHAKLFGRCEPKTGVSPFGRLVAQVMNTHPYRSAKRVFWIVDNGSSHRGQRSINRLQGQYPNLRLVHLPLHASWLNQVEIFFSILQRKVLTPNDFTELADVEHRVLAFQKRYQQTAAPFQWKFTRDDLADLMKKLHKAQQLQEQLAA